MGSELRRGRMWLPLVYYYLATVVGLVIMLVGVIGALRGLVQAIIPEASNEVRFSVEEPRISPEGKKSEKVTEAEKEERRADAIERARLGGYYNALQGLVTALVGAPVFVWHLRQARRKEPEWMGAATSEG